MPSTSKNQQRAMCMAYAARKGKLKVSELKGAALDIYKSDMTDSEIKDFMVLKENQGLFEYINNTNMKNLTDYINEATLSYEEKVQKWWDKQRTTAPVYCIKKYNQPWSGKFEFNGKPVIYNCKKAGDSWNNTSQADDKAEVGSRGYEIPVMFTKEQLLSDFREPDWTPFAYGYEEEGYNKRHIQLYSWEDIKEYIRDFDFQGTLFIYKGPQP